MMTKTKGIGFILALVGMLGFLTGIALLGKEIIMAGILTAMLSSIVFFIGFYMLDYKPYATQQDLFYQSLNKECENPKQEEKEETHICEACEAPEEDDYDYEREHELCLDAKAQVLVEVFSILNNKRMSKATRVKRVKKYLDTDLFNF